jgi:hypothetical protein
MIEAKAFRTFIKIYSLFKSEQLSTNIKLTFHKALIRSIMTYACPIWEFAADNHLLKLQRPLHWKFSKAHTGSRFTHGFQTAVYDYITKLCRQQAEVIQNHDNENVRSTGQGETPHRK